MKRIVVDARESGTSTGRYVDKLVEYLHKLQPAHQIVLLAKPNRVAFYKDIAPRFRVVTTTYKEFTFGEQIGFCRQIARLKADLVFFPMVQQPVLYRGRVVTEMLDLTTTRFRDPTKNRFVFGFKQYVYRWVNKYVAKKSRLLITLSEFVKQDVVSFCHVDPKKITVIYNAADKITAPAAVVKAAQGKEFLLFVGRPAANKNLYRLVDAFNVLAADRPQLHMVFAGKLNDEYRRLRDYARGSQHGTRIIFTDFVSDGQLRWLYEHASVYVFPSLSEGFGLPGLEAMQYGLPVASSNATCLPEVYKDAALYFDPLDTADMAAAVGRVLDEPKLAGQLAQKGRALVKTYSWQRCAEQTLAVFDKALR